VREWDDVLLPPRRCGAGLKSATPVDGVTVLVAPVEGHGSEGLVVGGVVEPQVTQSRVRQGDTLEEATLGGLDAEILLCEACAGEGDRADGADTRVDRNLAAGAGNRDPVVPVVNEVQLSHPYQRQGRGTGADSVVGLGKSLPPPAHVWIERAEQAVEVLCAGNGSDHRPDGDCFSLLASDVGWLVRTAAERVQRFVESQ
jgi:hypothetical protein